MRMHDRLVLSGWVAVLFVAAHDGLLAQAGTTSLVSVTADGKELTAQCLYSAVSDDGRFVAFASDATNVLPVDGNGAIRDVVLRDLDGPGETILISQSSDEVQGDGSSDNPSVSADGRYVAFDSASTNLDELDTNDVADVFLRDRTAGTTTLLSVNDSGVVGNGASTLPSTSADGSRTVFVSFATNLDTAFGPTPAGIQQVWLRELVAQPRTILVSKDAGGAAATANCTSAAISGDGRYVAFVTVSSLIGGRDTNGTDDVYLRDLVTSTTTLVSRRFDGDKKAAGNCANPALTFTGGLVAFDSPAADLVDLPLPTRRRVYVYEPATDTMRLVSLGLNGENPDQTAGSASLSSEGRYLCFNSAATNLVPGDTNGKSDVFLHDLTTGGTVIASVSSAGTLGNGDSGSIRYSISRGASVVAFRSRASNLVAGTAGTTPRIYVRRPSADLVAPRITCPADIQVSCTGTGGTTVTYTVTATDDVDPSPVVTVDPPSGSKFQPGTHTVTATAMDGGGNTATCSFDVTVGDTSAPSVQCPASVSAACTGPNGATVTFQATATDNCDPAPEVSAAPASGSLFPPGQTTVTVTATDSSGNSESCAFTVTVSGETPFLRGDSNGDRRVNVSDAVFTLRFLFAGGDDPSCLDAADANDDGSVTLTDPVFLLNFLAQLIPTIPVPGARTAGADPTPDDLGCGTSSC